MCNDHRLRIQYIKNSQPLYGHPGRGSASGYRRGLEHMVGSAVVLEAWEAELAAVPNTTIVLNSGIHDLAIPFADAPNPLDRVKVAPLLRYRLYVRQLCALIQRVRRRQPSVEFIWRSSIAQQLIGHSARQQHHHEKTGAPYDPPCSDGTWEQTYCPATAHPELVNDINQYASDRMRALGITVADEPSHLTFNALRQWTADGIHSSSCGMTMALQNSRARSLCAARRVAGEAGEANRAEYKGWARQGGLSLEVTKSSLLHLLDPTQCGRAHIDPSKPQGARPSKPQGARMARMSERPRWTFWVMAVMFMSPGRLEVSQVVLQHLMNIVKPSLREVDAKLTVLCAGSEREVSQDLAESLGAMYVECPNHVCQPR